MNIFPFRTSGWSRIIHDLLPDSRPLGALLLRCRPSRQLRILQPVPALNWCFWCGNLWPFCPESLQDNYWWHLRELSQQDSHLRELLLLVDQGVGYFLFREVQAELVRTSRNISDLRRRVTYLSICLLGVGSEPLFVPQILSAFRATSQPRQALIMGLPKGKGKGKSPDDLRTAQAFRTFSSNDALNFSRWYQVWQVNFFMAVLWSGYQGKHLEYALLLQLSRVDDSLPHRLLSFYFPGMFRGRRLSGLYFAHEPTRTCRSTFHHEGPCAED